MPNLEAGKIQRHSLVKYAFHAVTIQAVLVGVALKHPTATMTIRRSEQFSIEFTLLG